jgi:PAS domain S-box-containing protein
LDFLKPEAINKFVLNRFRYNTFKIMILKIAHIIFKTPVNEYIMRKNNIRIIILSLLLLSFRISFSQQYFIKTYTIEDGLPTRIINDACQDKDGLMWFATTYGISKYDGFSFTNYDFSSGLPEQQYKKIKIDERGVIWAMPDRIFDTIVCYKNNEWVKIPPLKAMPRNFQMNSLDVIYKNDKPVICVGSYNGIYTYENDSWSHISISEDFKLNYVYTILAGKKKFYLSTKIGLCILENGKLDWSLNKLNKSLGLDIIAINFDKNNISEEKLWVLNEKWLGYIQNNQFTLVTDKFVLPHPSIFYYAFVSSDKMGNIYFGNIWAKYYLSKDSDIPVPLMVANGFESEGATSVCIDREQNVWFTDTRGICKFNNVKIVSFFQKNGMRENEVASIAEMKDGRIVLGHNKGLSILSNNKFATIDFPGLEQKNQRVPNMIRDNIGNIWFVSIDLGLGRLHSNGNITWYTSDKIESATAVLQDKKGKIWVGGYNKLYYLQNDKLVEYEHNDKFINTLRRLFAGDNGRIYLAGSNGLWYLQDNKAEKIPSPSDKKAENVYSYFKDKKGTEFVGTLHGLYFIDNGRIVKFKRKGIEIDKPVFFIFQDTQGIYWIGSNDGVYRWDGESKIEVYNIYNGLAGWETNRAAGMTDSKGRIWIGTDRGLSCFLPGYDKTVIPTPVLNLQYIEDSKSVEHSLTEKCSISHNDNTLIFHFRGISFHNEDLIEYKYKLEGFDKDWQEASQAMLNKIKYIGLKPGKYTFCVKAKNFSGQWSEVSKSAVIKINQPIYLTWWFLVLTITGLSLIIYGFIIMKVQKLHNFKLEKEIVERKRIEQALTESKQKYQDLVGLLPETVFETNCRGTLLYLNDTGFRLFGYQNNELFDLNDIYQFIAPESIAEMTKHMNSVHELKQPNKTVLVGIKKDRTTFPFSIHTVPIIENDDCTGTRGIIIDLTEQKRFESQLQKNAEDLDALNKSKDKFFSIISHDLRSPFTSFLGFTEILDEELHTLPKDELQTIISSMRSSASNLYQLLENLLEWSLLHREITTFKPENTLLLPLVKTCHATIIDAAQHKGIGVSINVSDSISVVADIHMLQTIIRNLLSNAIKFTHRGGFVEISATASEKHLVTISVKDTGIGIRAELFEKIFLIDTINKTKGTEGELSTGLGLILCKEFVEKHGGKIWVESEAGNGSTFNFTLAGNMNKVIA